MSAAVELLQGTALGACFGTVGGLTVIIERARRRVNAMRRHPAHRPTGPIAVHAWVPTEGPGSGDDRYSRRPATEMATLPGTSAERAQTIAWLEQQRDAAWAISRREGLDAITQASWLSAGSAFSEVVCALRGGWAVPDPVAVSA